LLRNSRDISDEDVHQLIGRLFFIRSCEDRDIVERESLLKLSSVTHAEGLSGALHTYFLALQALFESELFADTSGRQARFDDGILGEIIRELYRPIANSDAYRYDFAYLNVDVLGMAYERYVATVLERVEPSTPQLALPIPEIPTEEVEATSRQREQGTYYTPSYLADYLASHVLDPLLTAARSPHDLPAVADISAGSGGFLVRAAERMARRARELDAGTQQRNWQREVVMNLFGVDFDERAVILARVNLLTLASMGQPPRPLPELTERVVTADALFDPIVDDMRGKFDVILGNPPFRSAASLPAGLQDQLRRRYRSAVGRFDLAYVFLERALELVRPGGRIGFVIPNRLFTNTDARHIRELISSQAILERIVDFGDQQAFEGALSYTAAIVLRKRCHEDAADPVFVHRLRRLSDYPALQLRHADLTNGTGLDNEHSQAFRAPQPDPHAPWVWSSDQEGLIVQKVDADSVALADVADVRQGVKTGANDLFLLQRAGTDARRGLWLMANGLGEEVALEPALLRPAVRGPQARNYAIPEVSDGSGAILYALYPYIGQRLLDFAVIRREYPAVADYLTKHHDVLAARATARRGGEWYDLSWSRGDAWIDNPKLISPVLVSAATFSLDNDGRFLPIGGTVVTPKDSVISVEILAAVLNSAIFSWYLRRRAPAFKGGYLEVKPHDVREFRYPWAALIRDHQVRRHLEKLASSAWRSARAGVPFDALAIEIDDILFDAIGLTTDERALVADRAGHAQALAVASVDAGAVDLTIERRLAGITNSTSGHLDRELILLRDALQQSSKSGAPNAPLRRLAGIAAQRLIDSRPHTRQVALLVSLVRSALSHETPAAETGPWVRSLRAAGIEVGPTIVRASVVLGPGTEDSDQPEE
jgi:type I restriction-modification system DNA methylase subunit